jgi:hypothetical protein
VADVPVQEHVFDPATEVCVHCHVPKRNVVANAAISCVYRWVDASTIARVDRPKVSAVNDFEFIGARLEQLRGEQAVLITQKRDDE